MHPARNRPYLLTTLPIQHRTTRPKMDLTRSPTRTTYPPSPPTPLPTLPPSAPPQKKEILKLTTPAPPPPSPGQQPPPHPPPPRAAPLTLRPAATPPAFFGIPHAPAHTRAKWTPRRKNPSSPSSSPHHLTTDDRPRSKTEPPNKNSAAASTLNPAPARKIIVSKVTESFYPSQISKALWKKNHTSEPTLRRCPPPTAAPENLRPLPRCSESGTDDLDNFKYERKKVSESIKLKLTGPTPTSHRPHPCK